jgi:hypothetical protein
MSPRTSIAQSNDNRLRITPQRNCLDRETALRMWTENVTRFSNEEGKKGPVEVGQLADLIVPDRDYFSCAEADIADATSDLTMVGGKVVYAPATSGFTMTRRHRRRCPTGRRSGPLAATARGARNANPPRRFACKPPTTAVAPTVARSTATIMPPPGRPSFRSRTSGAFGAHSAAPVGRSDQEMMRRLEFLAAEESANIPQEAQMTRS